MCSKQEIMTMIELAKKLESSQPKEAARQYFLVAEALVKCAKDEPDEEQKYL